MAAEEAETGDRRRAIPKESPYSNAAFLAMENVVDKLKILNYEKNFCEEKHVPPLERTAFALPGSNPSVQFQNYLELVSWLCAEATGNLNTFRIDKFDDPNTSVNKMMLALRDMGFELEFPVNKIKQGHGEAACGVLEFLADKALGTRGFVWASPEHETAADMEEAEVDEDADLGDIEDEAEVMEDEEAMFSDLAQPEEEFEASTHQMIENTIDPLVWKTELERVGPRLKAVSVSLGKEWRAHIEQTKQHERTIQSTLPSTQGHMQNISSQIRDAVEKMRSKEVSINNQYDTLRAEYGELRGQLNEIEKKYQASSSNVNELTNQMTSLQEQLDELKEEMATRESSATDTSPLVAIKHALQAIKGDVKTHDLRIGVVSHTLMQAKLRVAKSKLRKSKRGSGDAKEEDDVDIELEDDDGGILGSRRY